MTRILVVGVPRSGSTWTAEVLGLAHQANMVHEPDNAALYPVAAPMTRARGLFPVIQQGQSAPDYKALWDLAFAGGWPDVGVTRATGRALRRLPPRFLELLLRAAAPATTRLRPRPAHVVTKSVYAAFSVEWLAAVYEPRVVLVERNALNVASSWVDLGVPFGDFDQGQHVAWLAHELQLPPPIPTSVHHKRVAWCVAFLMTLMRDTAARHADWLVVSHGRLAAAPESEFGRLFGDLGLTWTAAVDSHLAASNRPGTGYKTHRVRSEVSEAWRRRLTPEQARDIQAVFAQFPGQI